MNILHADESNSSREVAERLRELDIEFLTIKNGMADIYPTFISDTNGVLSGFANIMTFHARMRRLKEREHGPSKE